jgi:hypothetical protein
MVKLEKTTDRAGNGFTEKPFLNMLFFCLILSFDKISLVKKFDINFSGVLKMR